MGGEWDCYVPNCAPTNEAMPKAVTIPGHKRPLNHVLPVPECFLPHSAAGPARVSIADPALLPAFRRKIAVGVVGVPASLIRRPVLHLRTGARPPGHDRVVSRLVARVSVEMLVGTEDRSDVTDG